MSKVTIGEVVSRVRNRTKAVRQDAFLTDRFIYSLISKQVKFLVKREDGANKIMQFNSIFQTLDYVPLKEVDKVEAGCSGISACSTFRRTEHKLTAFMEGYCGPLVRAMTSLDGSERLQRTTPVDYLALSKSKNFKYNKTHYYWYLNDYFYFPDVDWEAVRVEGVPEDDISSFKCDEKEQCMPRQDQLFNVPDYLHGEVEQQVIQDVYNMFKIPNDPVHDNVNPLK